MKKPCFYIDSIVGSVNIFEKESLSLIVPEIVFLGNSNLIPGEKTTLNDFFNQSVEFLGIYEDKLQFNIGTYKDLFEDLVYCNSFKKIDDKCFVNIYRLGTARSYIFKNGVWK